MSPDDAIKDARARRFALHQAMLDLEHSVQAPAATPTWRSTLFTELHDLSTALEDHIAIVEGPAGIIEQAIAKAPRTAMRGERLRDEHPALRAQVKAAIDLVQASEVDMTEDRVVAIRAAVVELLVGLYRHRQQGSDFVWEAYDVDIGGVG